MIRLTRSGLVLNGPPAELRQLRQQFDREHHVILPKLLEPELLEMVLRRVEAARFTPNVDDHLTSETTMQDPDTVYLLTFLFNMPAFQRVVQRITGCRRIATFNGRVYRMSASEGHHTVWHNDIVNHRMVACSLNLGREEFRGGALQLRYRDSKQILHEVHNTGLGDALLIRVSRKLVHRVSPVEGDAPKIALAGWFRWDRKDYHSALRSGAGKLKNNGKNSL